MGLKILRLVEFSLFGLLTLFSFTCIYAVLLGDMLSKFEPL